MSLSDYLRTLIRWLASLHAPLGRGSPFAASALFLVAGFAHSRLVHSLAYLGACAVLALIAADIAKSFIDPGSFPLRRAAPLTWPIFAFRLLLTACLGGIYSFFVFVGVGPWMPILVWPVILAICFFIAWRNVDLWYEEGAEFEEELAEEAHRQDLKLTSSSQPQVR